MKLKTILLVVLVGISGGLFFAVSHSHAPIKKADMVIFSFDRPMQLYALLESIQTYMTGYGQVTVIYRASSATFADAYEMVHQKFGYADFIKQGENPAADFKPLTLQATFGSPHQYVIFAVDDIIVKDHVNLSECIDLLEEAQAYGFYLRWEKI